MENVSEIVSQTNRETRPHEFMILVRDENLLVTPNVAPTHPCVRYRDCSRILYYVNCGILFSMYGPLIGLVQVKFQNNNESPFETHHLFMIMSVVAFSTCALSFRLLVYTTLAIRPSIYYMAVTSVIFFFAILAPLSLVLVLFIPPRLIWVGYSIVCLLFLSVVTYNFIDYILLFGNKFSATTNVTKWWFRVKG